MAKNFNFDYYEELYPRQAETPSIDTVVDTFTPTADQLKKEQDEAPGVPVEPDKDTGDIPKGDNNE